MGYYNLERREILPFITNHPKKVLDVGCGEGFFGKMLMNEFQVLVYGIEPDINSYAKSKINLTKSYQGTLEQVRNSISEKFDIIFFNDVLEHMVDPWAALESVQSLLNPNGLVIASLPNILHFYVMKDILLSRDWRYQNKGILDKTHLRFFTKKSLERMFLESGYTVKKLEGINPVKSRGVRLINIFTFGKYQEIKYPQYVVVATLK